MSLPIPPYPQLDGLHAPAFVRMYAQCGTAPEVTYCDQLCWCFPIMDDDLQHFIIDVRWAGLPNGTGKLDVVNEVCETVQPEVADFEIIDGYCFVTWAAGMGTPVPDDCFRLGINVATFVGSHCNIGTTLALDTNANSIQAMALSNISNLNIPAPTLESGYSDSDFAISFWGLMSNNGNGGAAFLTFKDEPCIYVDGSGNLVFTDGVASVSCAIDASNPHHYVFGRKDITLYLYVDGIQVDFGFSYTPQAITGTRCILGEVPDCSSPYQNNFAVANLLIRRLTQAEGFPTFVDEIYNQGLCGNYPPNVRDQGYWRFIDPVGSPSFYNERFIAPFFPTLTTGDWKNGPFFQLFEVPGGDFPDSGYNYVTDCFCKEQECATAVVTVTDGGRGILPYPDLPDDTATYDQFAQMIRLPVTLIPSAPLRDARVEVNSQRKTRAITTFYRRQYEIDTDYMPGNVIEALVMAMGGSFFAVTIPGTNLPLQLVSDVEAGYIFEGPRPYRLKSKLRQKLIVATTGFKKDYCS